MSIKRFVFVACMALTASAQTVTWSAKPATATWPTNGGYINWANAFDTLSGQFIGYGQTVFIGTVSVTNGSNIATWISGTYFSEYWHAPNQVTIGGTQAHVATGTFPTGCTTGVPVSCTKFTMAANWATASGTFAYKASSQSIYSDTITYYNATNNTWTYGPGLGTLENYCAYPANLPGMRQNGGFYSIDSKRGRLYLGGGANEACKLGVTTNGTSTVTTTLGTSTCATACFPFQPDLNLVGMNVVFPSGGTCGIGGAVCTTVATAPSEQLITVNCGSGSFPACSAISGFTSMQLLPPAQNQSNNFIQDTWYLTLNANPALDTFTQVPITFQSGLLTNDEQGMAYDTDDDGFIYWGQTITNTWVFCTGDGNPGGTLTSLQLSIGCVTPNVWANITTSASPPGTFEATLIYDSVHHWVWQYGSGEASGQGSPTQTDPWKYSPHAKTWVAMSSTNQPPQTFFSQQPAAIILDTKIDKLILHVPDVPADYSYDPSTNNWTTLVTAGTSPTCVSPYTIAAGTACNTGTTLGYDSIHNILVAVSQGSVGSPSTMYLWTGNLPQAPSLSKTLTVQEALYPGDSTGHTYSAAGGIARTNDTWCNGFPLADADGVSSTAFLGLTGATAGQFRTLASWPDGNIKDLEACGQLASFTAGSTATVTLTGTGSGSFGTPATMTSVSGGTITINTGAATFTMLGTAGTPGGFDGIDSVVVGPTTAVGAGTSSGFVIAGPANPATDCGTASPCNVLYTSKNDPASVCSVEKDGPVEADILCNWTFTDSSSNAYMTGSARYYYRNGATNARIVSVLKNAAYGTSNTFATAFKALQAYEFRMGSNLGSSLSWNVGNHLGVGSPTTGTMTGTDTVLIYQGQNTTFGDSTWSLCDSPCTALTLDTGYTIKKNGSAVQTGTNAQAPVGYAYLANGSGNYIEAGTFLFAGSGPKSLEFQNGGTGTDAIRVGLFSAQNSWPVYMPWPQYRTDEFYLEFGTSTPANIPNVYLAQQHNLIANASITQWNASGVLPYSLSTPLEEDTYYYGTVTAASPSITTASGCAGGASYVTLGCIFDVGTQSSTWPLLIYPMGYTYEQGGGRDQIEWRQSWLTNVITRHHTGRWLQVKTFEMMQQDMWSQHTDGTYTWRSKTPYSNTGALLDFYGHPNAASTPPSGTCNSSGTTVTLVSGAYFGPWWPNQTSGAHVTVNGVNYTISAVTSTTSLTTSTTVPTLSGTTCSLTTLAGTNLRLWPGQIGNGNGPDNPHSHVTAAFLYYLMSGDATQYQEIRDTFDDFQLNLDTAQGGVYGSQANGIGNTNGSGTTLTITSGSIPSYVTAAPSQYPIFLGSTTANYAAYPVVSASGSTVVLGSPAPTITGAKWFFLSGALSARGAGLAMSNGAEYANFLASVGDTSNAAIALQGAENVYYMQAKPALCLSGFPASCTAATGGNLPTGPWTTAGVSPTRGSMYQASSIVGVTSTACSPFGSNERAQSPFQANILEEGIWTLRAQAGSGWSEYTNSLDLLSGSFLWSLSEAANFDGTSTWTSNGYRYYIFQDYANCPADMTYYPVRANQSLWMHHYYWSQYYGAIPTVQKKFLTEAIQQFMSPNPVGVGLTAQGIDVGAYQLNSVIYEINHGPTNTLQTVPLTSFANNGGGSYTIGWTNPSAPVSVRAKYGLLPIVDWVGFDPVASSFSSSICSSAPISPITCSGNATTTQPWFASTEIGGMPPPIPGAAQTVTVNGLSSSTLTSPNFLIKAMAPPTSGASTFSGIMGGNGIGAGNSIQ